MKREMTRVEREILAHCVRDNPTGRIGWPLSTWEGAGGARERCLPLIKLGYLRERRLGGYPGVEITEAGRTALAKDGGKDG